MAKDRKPTVGGRETADPGDDSKMVEELSRRLHEKMWHLEPSEQAADEEWNGMSECEKDYYRVIVRFFLRELRAYGFVRPTTTM
jgi:hypothetical protein